MMHMMAVDKKESKINFKSEDFNFAPEKQTLKQFPCFISAAGSVARF